MAGRARDDKSYGLFKDVMGMDKEVPIQMAMTKIVPVQVCGGCGKLWMKECDGTCQTVSPYVDDATLTQVSKWAAEYTDHLEVTLTEKACLCKWIYRDPKPVENPKILAETPAKPRLRARSHEHPECPVHTRRGLLVGFVKWILDKHDTDNQVTNMIKLWYADDKD